MKQSNFFLLGAALLSLASCTGQKSPKSLASSWQAKHFSDSDTVVRELASSNASGMCLNSIFSTETLKKEVLEYERKFSGTPVRGSFRHIDLSTLPLPQANFLSRFGKEIGDQANPESIDYSGCYDLPCIFNRIYEKEDDYIAGYVHYLWYLKFGSYLSLDNKVPDQESLTPGMYNKKQFRVQDYLYNEKELYGLWRITHLLTEPFTSLTNLNEIQRIPRGESLEGYESNVCGLASSTGNIRLQDGCLNISTHNQDKGFLYLGVIHEMTHMLDYLQAKQRRISGWYRSHEQDYLDIVGFYKVEYTDDEGKLVSEWKLRDGAKTIRDYAATSPVENFADTLAYFRQEGEQTKRSIDSHQYSWVSKNYYHNDVFDKMGNRERLLRKYESTFTGQILTKVMDCSSTQKSYQSNYFNASDFSGMTITSWMLKCLSHEAETIAASLTARVKTYEADGCASLETREDQLEWNNLIKSSLLKQFSVYVEELTNDPEYLEKVRDFTSTLKKRVIANEALFQCYKGSTQENLQSCYDLKVVEISKKAALDLKLPPHQAEEMSLLYLGTHPYSTVAQELYLSYRTILNSHEEMIREETEDLWNRCLNVPHDDDQKHTGQIFTLRKGYLVSSIYNCLNSELPTLIKDLVRSLEFEGEKITHPVEEMIFLEFMEPKVVAFLREAHEVESANELKELPYHFEKDREMIKEFLASDFSWIKSLSDKTSLRMSCRREALTQISYLPLYHVKRDVFTDMILNGPCQEIYSDPRYLKFIESSKSLVENEVFSKVEVLLTKYAEERALYCKQIIPWKWERTRATVRLPRKGCMSLGWDDVERAVVSELLQSPTSQRFKVDQSEIRSQISKFSSKVRNKIEEKHF